MDSNEFKTKKERPTLLTALCILTFVVSGIMLFSSLYNLITFDPIQKEAQVETAILEMDKALSDQNNPFGAELLDNYKLLLSEAITYAKTIHSISLLSILLSLAGAYFMFSLKKIGLHLYIISKIIALTPLFIYTNTFIVNLSYGIGSLFMLSFIILYALHIKHME